MRPRDALGRPVRAGSPLAVPPVPEEALPPEQALALARELLAQGRAFAAHEVFEAVWKASPADDRSLWQGLAQLCVGVTHLQRGNRVGAARLLRRGAGHLDTWTGTSYDAHGAAARARVLATEVEGGGGQAVLDL